MPSFSNPAFLIRRIDRCYLIAAASKIAEKRKRYLDLARHYREMLQSLGNSAVLSPA